MLALLLLIFFLLGLAIIYLATCRTTKVILGMISLAILTAVLAVVTLIIRETVTSGYGGDFAAVVFAMYIGLPMVLGGALGVLIVKCRQKPAAKRSSKGLKSRNSHADSAGFVSSDKQQ